VKSFTNPPENDYWISRIKKKQDENQLQENKVKERSRTRTITGDEGYRKMDENHYRR
jgi:hypothetical protein